MADCCSGGTRVVGAGAGEPRAIMTKTTEDVRFLLVVVCASVIHKYLKHSEKVITFQKKKSAIKRQFFFANQTNFFCEKQRSPVSTPYCPGIYFISYQSSLLDFTAVSLDFTAPYPKISLLDFIAVSLSDFTVISLQSSLLFISQTSLLFLPTSRHCGVHPELTVLHPNFTIIFHPNCTDGYP